MHFFFFFFFTASSNDANVCDMQWGFKSNYATVNGEIDLSINLYLYVAKITAKGLHNQEKTN